MNPDPRWLEILKASGWQTTAIAVACGIFLFLSHTAALPEPPSGAILAVSFIGILCGCLAFASWGNAACHFFPLHKWLAHSIEIRRSQQGLKKYIPFMTEDERKIIAYLLAHNQKTFTAAADGGYAATLLSRGIVIVLAQHGQQLHAEDVPMTIPDPLWDVFVEHKEQFPYTSQDDDESHPWRVSWMAR